MKCMILMALTVTLVVAGERPAIPARLTMPEALEITLRSSASLRRAEAQLRQSEGQSMQLRSGLLPQVSIGASDALQAVNLKTMGLDFPGLPSRVGPFQTVDARAYLTQNVFQWQAVERNRAGRAQWEASAAQRNNVREMVTLQVATGFAQALRAQSSSARLSEQVQLARQLVSITEERLRAGVASELEVKRSRQQMNNLEQSWIESRNSLTTAKLQLAHLMHAQVSASFELVDDSTPDADPPDAAGALAESMDARADYRAAQSQLRAAEHNLKSVKAQRYPVIQFQAGYGQSGRKPFENLNTFHIRGVLQMPVFTGGRIAGEQTEAEGKVEEARAALDEIRSQVETEVLSGLSALQSAREQTRVAQSTVGLAKDELSLALERFTSGVADNTEVVNAQDRLSRAEDNLVRAEYQTGIARAQMRRATGAAQ